MELGGPGALARLREPFDGHGSGGSCPPSPTTSPKMSPQFGPAGSPPSPVLRPARTASPGGMPARAVAADRRASAGDRRPLPIGRRPTAVPLRSSASVARAALQQSMRADGKCFALCIADRLDLERLAASLGSTLPVFAGAAAGVAVGLAPPLLPGMSDELAAAEAGQASSPACARSASRDGVRVFGTPPRTALASQPGVATLLRPTAAAIGGAASAVAGLVKGAVSGSTPAASSSSPAEPTASSRELGRGLLDAELVKVFGTGESMVLQVKMFRGKDVFAFRFGAVVCWGFASKERKVLPTLFKDYTVRPLQEDELDEEMMEFAIRRKQEGDDDDEDEDGAEEDPEKVGANCIRQDQIILATTSPFERLAHAYALAQSVRLGVFEVVVDRSIAKTRSIPETMATTGEIAVEERELLMQIGGLMMLRCDVNLHTDILDTPDIFWDEERFEPHYIRCRDYLDIDKRVDILNQRLGVLKDLYDLLQNTLNVNHGNKLEWIIIILILVEVLLELLELVHDAWSS